MSCMAKPAPILVDVVNVALRDKLPLKIDWDKLNQRAVASAVAEHILMSSDVVPRARKRVVKPDGDLVDAINFVLRHGLPGTVKWTDEPESDIVAYAVAEHVQHVFDVKRRLPARRKSGNARAGLLARDRSE